MIETTDSKHYFQIISTQIHIYISIIFLFYPSSVQGSNEMCFIYVTICAQNNLSPYQDLSLRQFFISLFIVQIFTFYPTDTISYHFPAPLPII